MYYKKETMFISELNRHAKLYIGLPDDYETSNKAYPVLYMNDGHNVFDKNDSFLGVTWGIIEAYENDKDLPEIIVVGLSCAEGLDRVDEYSPFEFKVPSLPRVTGGKGDVYLDYLVHVLKPQIDSQYRTLANDTGIMGSSMGGLISCYAALKYGEVYSRVAALSNSFFLCIEPIIDTIINSNLTNIKKFYLDAGDCEVEGGKNSDFIIANNQVYEALKNKLSSNQLKYEIIEGAKHHESEWAKRLPDILKFLYS